MHGKLSCTSEHILIMELETIVGQAGRIKMEESRKNDLVMGAAGK